MSKHKKGRRDQRPPASTQICWGHQVQALGTGLLQWGLHPTQSQLSHSIIFLKSIYKYSWNQCQEKNTAQLAECHPLGV